MSVVDKICHYQRSLQNCRDDDDQVLHCISKLYDLPITMQHLQETGIGRTVYSFRKCNGTVGEAAKALIFKWKLVVVSARSEDEDEGCVFNENGLPENGLVQLSGHTDSSVSSSSSSESAESEHGHKEVKSESSTKHNTTLSSKSEGKHEKKHSSKHHSQSERRSSEKGSKSVAKREEGHSSTKHNSSRNSDMKKNSDRTTKNEEIRKRKADSSSFLIKESKKRKLSDSKSDDEKSQSSVSERNHSRSKPAGCQMETKIKANDESSSSFSGKSKQDVKQEKKEQERSKSSSGKSKPTESSSKKKDSSEKQKHKTEEYASRKKHEAKKDSSHHSSKETSKSKVSSSSDYLKSKNKDKKKGHEKKKEAKVKLMEINGDEGIDCNSGTSFAEALGMCQMPQPSKKRHNNSSNISLCKTIKTERMSPPIAMSSKKMPTVKVETGCSNVSNPPSLLAPNVKLEPLSVDLASTLPEISPNYKPLPYINPVHRKEEVKHADDMIYVKNQRTKVYSGNKGGYTSVPTLYDICIRVLIENIEALEYTGGVPYDILKPVLERATPDQLYMLEHYNSYLVEDTDTLWQYHCNREFRNKERQEMESWREMYMRCLDEREAKLKTLTANIRQSIDKSVPVRSTKLAYVDNVVKPPRNVMKKQAKYGTANATPSTISSVKKKLAAGGAVNNATNIVVPPPPMARFKATTSNSAKKTKAPLMAKALQLIKGRYKR